MSRIRRASARDVISLTLSIMDASPDVIIAGADIQWIELMAEEASRHNLRWQGLCIDDTRDSAEFEYAIRRLRASEIDLIEQPH